MATHPRKPKDPNKPTKNRHVVEKARSLKHDARGSQEIMERDCQRVIEWLGAAPLRTITSQELRTWVAKQDPPWTPGYWNAIKAMVQDGLSSQTRESSEQTRDKLVRLVDHLLPECRKLVTWKAYNPTDPAVKDPRTPQFITWRRLMSKKEMWSDYEKNKAACLFSGQKEPAPPFSEPWGEQDDIALLRAEEACPFLTEIDHGAVKGYLQLVAQLTGLAVEKVTNQQNNSTFVVFSPPASVDPIEWAKSVQGQVVVE